ncbi:zinc finger, CCHC-type containing protein [Tanacetum coccineum]
MHSLGKTVNELHAMLKLHEQTLPKNNAPALHVIRAGKVQKGNNKHKKQQPQLAARGPNQGKGKNKLTYAPKPKIPPPPKREDPAKDSICHECGKIGHCKRNCAQYLAELLKKKKNTASGAGGSGTFMRRYSYMLSMLEPMSIMCIFHRIPKKGNTMGILSTTNTEELNSVVARNAEIPRRICDLHWTTVKNIIKYLRNTKDMFLVYEGDLKRESGFLLTNAEISDGCGGDGPQGSGWICVRFKWGAG